MLRASCGSFIAGYPQVSSQVRGFMWQSISKPVGGTPCPSQGSLAVQVHTSIYI